MMHIRRFLLTCAAFVLAMAGGEAISQTAAKQQPAGQASAQKAPSAASPTVKPSDRDLNIRAYIELLRSDVKAEAAGVFAAVMQLDDNEAKIFWPIYREYELELSRQGDKRIQLIKKYADNLDSLSNEMADQIVQGSFALEQERQALKKKYYERIKQALSAKTAARFVQINNQLLMLIDLQIASALPVVK